jgi:hypothetical protein
MNAWLRGVVLLATMAATVAAGVDGRGEKSWAEPLFGERSHDFGPVPRGATVRHAFYLTNRLAEPVSIINLRASCGCTTGRANVSTVPPGGQAVIEAAMDTTNYVGRKATTLFVILVTPSGKQEEVGLAVSSTILSDIVLNPGTIDFGTVARGQEVTRTLTIDRLGAPAWRVEKMVSASKVIDAWLDETGRDSRNVQYRLTVKLKPETSAGLIRDEVRVLTNDSESPAVPILVTGQVLGELAVSPAILPLGRIANNGQAQGRYLIKGDRPFQIVALEGQGNGFSLDEFEPGAKNVHLINLTYKTGPNTTLGDLRQVFRVVTDLPGEAPLEIVAALRVDP